MKKKIGERKEDVVYILTYLKNTYEEEQKKYYNLSSQGNILGLPNVYTEGENYSRGMAVAFSKAIEIVTEII